MRVWMVKFSACRWQPLTQSQLDCISRVRPVHFAWHLNRHVPARHWNALTCARLQTAGTQHTQCGSSSTPGKTAKRLLEHHTAFTRQNYQIVVLLLLLYCTAMNIAAITALLHSTVANYRMFLSLAQRLTVRDAST